MKKRVLIIGYNIVDLDMGGVRLRRIARLLPRHGWEPVVLTHTRQGASLAEPAEGTRLEQVAAPDLARIYARLRRLGRKRPQPARPAAPNRRPRPSALPAG